MKKFNRFDDNGEDDNVGWTKPAPKVAPAANSGPEAPKKFAIFVPHASTLAPKVDLGSVVPDINLAEADVDDEGWTTLKHRDDVVDEIGGITANMTPKTAVVGRKVASKTDAITMTRVAEIVSQVQELKDKKTILKTIASNKITCIQGNTGCGKSSIIPLELYLEDPTRFIIVAQPRRLAAVGLATRVSKVLGKPVGNVVGYRIGAGAGGAGGDNRLDSVNTRILYVTSGYLFESIVRSNELWNKCTHLILDEVHERTIESDALALVVRMKLKSDIVPPGAVDKRIVLMSATMQQHLFSEYFGTLAAHLEISTNKFTVEEVYAENFRGRDELGIGKETASIIDKYLVKVGGASTKPPPLHGDIYTAVVNMLVSVAAAGTAILVFLPGLGEIESMYKVMTGSTFSKTPNCPIEIFILHSTVETSEQQRATEPVARGVCRIVLATNIAETSITIPDVKIVFDFGMARRIEYDSTKNMRSIVCGWSSKSAARQRAGRAGRVSNGVVYRMYTRNLHASMLANDKSELLPLEHTALQICANLSAYGDVATILGMLVEPPSEDEIRLSVERLESWGMICRKTGIESRIITKLGRIALSMPIDITLTRMLMIASRLGFGIEMAIIAAGITASSPLITRPLTVFYSPDEYARHVRYYEAAVAKFDRSRRNDLYMNLAIFEETCHLSGGELTDFCRTNYLSVKQVSTFLSCVSGIAMALKQIGEAYNIPYLGSFGAFARSPSRDRVTIDIYRDSVKDSLLQLLLARHSNALLVCRRNVRNLADGGRDRDPGSKVLLQMNGVPKMHKTVLANLRREIEIMSGSNIRSFDYASNIMFDFDETAIGSENMPASCVEDISPPIGMKVLFRIQNSSQSRAIELKTTGIPAVPDYPSVMGSVCAYYGDGSVKSNIVKQTVVLDRWSNAAGIGDVSERAPQTMIGISMGVMELENIVVADGVSLISRTGAMEFLSILMACDAKATTVNFNLDDERLIEAVNFDGNIITLPNPVDINMLHVFNNLLTVMNGSGSGVGPVEYGAALTSLRLFFAGDPQPVSKKATIRSDKIRRIIVNGRYDVATMLAVGTKAPATVSDYEDPHMKNNRWGF